MCQNRVTGSKGWGLAMRHRVTALLYALYSVKRKNGLGNFRFLAFYVAVKIGNIKQNAMANF
jgi:hypothetical protein